MLPSLRGVAGLNGKATSYEVICFTNGMILLAETIVAHMSVPVFFFSEVWLLMKIFLCELSFFGLEVPRVFIKTGDYGATHVLNVGAQLLLFDCHCSAV